MTMMDLTDKVGFELDCIRTQVDRMAQCHRDKKQAYDFTPAWYAARAHIAELARILAKGEDEEK